jgi:hypothetical protein
MLFDHSLLELTFVRCHAHIPYYTLQFPVTNYRHFIDIVAIHLIVDGLGRPSGDAFAEFTSDDLAAYVRHSSQPLGSSFECLLRQYG